MTKTSFKTAALALLTAAGITLGATGAQAGGFIADVVDNFVPGSGRVLDGIHDRIGKPLDRFAPNHGGFRPAVHPRHPVMGNFCATPAGVYGPGPFNPVGSGCHAVVFGQVVFGHVIR